MAAFAKQKIKQSFIKLLNQKPLSQITVKDIVDDCNVNRNSFYYHFQDIPHLLEEVIVDMADRGIASLPENSTIDENLEKFLEGVVKNKKAIYHIYISPNRELYEGQLMKICDYITKQYLIMRRYPEDIKKEDIECIISFLKCEMFGQIINWLNHNMSYDIIEHSHHICTLFSGSIKSVCLKNLK